MFFVMSREGVISPENPMELLRHAYGYVLQMRVATSIASFVYVNNWA